MKPLDKCPVCGGELVEKEVEKLLKGGERLYPEATVRRFEWIRQKLATEDVAEFQPLGQTYQVA